MYRERPPDVPNETEESGFGSEIGDFAKNGHLYAPVTATKPLQTTANRHKIATKPLQIATDCHGQPQTATKPLQTVMDYLRLPPTPLNHRRLPPSYSQTTAEPPGPLPGSRKLCRAYQ